jgi:hypothetical protein
VAPTIATTGFESLLAMKRYSTNEKAPSVSGEASRLLRGFTLDQRVRTLDACQRVVLRVVLVVERFTAAHLSSAAAGRKAAGVTELGGRWAG